jgi:hypothetical protein
MICIFHKWSKWEQYDEQVRYYFTGPFSPPELLGKSVDKIEQRQKRRCEKCNKIQDKKTKK